MRQPDNRIIRLDLPSSLNSVYILHAVIKEIVRDIELDEKTADDVSLAVIEAGTNAIKHGNQEDPSKRARFEFSIQPSQFTVVVSDQGPGFRRDEVPSPLAEENRFKSSGRGLFLIEDCMDSVTYEKSGTLVRMVKNLGLSSSHETDWSDR